VELASARSVKDVIKHVKNVKIHHNRNGDQWLQNNDGTDVRGPNDGKFE